MLNWLHKTITIDNCSTVLNTGTDLPVITVLRYGYADLNKYKVVRKTFTGIMIVSSYLNTSTIIGLLWPTLIHNFISARAGKP